MHCCQLWSDRGCRALVPAGTGQQAAALVVCLSACSPPAVLHCVHGTVFRQPAATPCPNLPACRHAAAAAFARHCRPLWRSFWQQQSTPKWPWQQCAAGLRALLWQ